ncbi:hypothetical protein [Methanobrevibacter sp.]
MENIDIADESNAYSKVTFSCGIVFEYGSSGQSMLPLQEDSLMMKH